LFRSFLPLAFGAVRLFASVPEATIVTAAGEELRLEAGGTAHVLACFDSGVLREVPGYIRAPQSGEHWLLSAAVDEFGRRSRLQWTRVVVDSDPPVLKYMIEPAAVVSGNTSWLTPESRCRLEAEDGISGVHALQAVINGVSEESGTSMLELRLPAEGNVEIALRANDEVGNISPPLNARFVVDSRPPEAGWKIEGPWNHDELAPVIGSSTRIHCWWKDAESGIGTVAYLLDGQTAKEGEFGGPWKAGRHLITTRASDRCGNENSLKCEFVADLEAPEISARLVSTSFRTSDGRLFARPPFRLDLAAEDEPAGVEALEFRQSGNDAWIPCPATLEFPAEQIPEIRAVDRVGNISRFEVFWILDDRGPEIEIEAISGGFSTFGDESIVAVRGASIGVGARDSGSGLQSIRYRLDGGKWRKIPDTIVFGFPDTRSLEIEAADRLGNMTRRKWMVRVMEAEEVNHE